MASQMDKKSEKEMETRRARIVYCRSLNNYPHDPLTVRSMVTHSCSKVGLQDRRVECLEVIVHSKKEDPFIV